MSLTEQINNDLKEAMKAGRKIELETLRSIRAAILEFEKKKIGSVMTEEDELALLTSQLKTRKDSIEQYKAAGRQDLVDHEAAQIDVIMKYLPAQLSEDEIKAAVADVIALTGAKTMADLGKVMGPAMKALKGRVDGTAVQAVVRSMLGG